MELLILAAGMGSRFGGLKQIEPMDEFGNFIIDYSVYDAIEAGFDSVTFVIKEEMYEDFKETIGKRIESHIKVKYAFQKVENIPSSFKYEGERIKPWGTAHAILAAKDLLEDDFVMINADDFYGKDAYKVAANYLKGLKGNRAGKYANVVFNVANTITENGSVKRGVCIKDEKGELKEMIESSIERVSDGTILATPLDKSIKPFTVSEDAEVSMNMFIFTKDILAHLDERFLPFLEANRDDILKCEYLIPTVVSELQNEGKCSVKLLNTSSVWYGVTYKEDKEMVVSSLKALVEKGEYKKGLYQ